MESVYVIMRGRGEYDDYTEEVVAVVATEPEATRFCTIKNGSSDEYEYWFVPTPAHLTADAALGL